MAPYCTDPDEEPEPGVDLSAFLEKQRTRASADDAGDISIIGAASANHPAKGASTSAGVNVGYDASSAQDEGEVDYELERMMFSVQMGGRKGNAQTLSLNRKNNKQVLEWDEEMETMQREKTAAEAMRGMSRSLHLHRQWFLNYIRLYCRSQNTIARKPETQASRNHACHTC